jgi:BMFP domain-containing protein YqiC
MTNILKEQQEKNKELLDRIANLEKKLADKNQEQEVKQLNNEEIRQ